MVLLLFLLTAPPTGHAVVAETDQFGIAGADWSWAIARANVQRLNIGDAGDAK